MQNKLLNSFSRYQNNYGSIRKYNDHNYKLTVFKTLVDTMPELRTQRERGTANEKKLDNNISRTRSTIYDIVASNPWDYFVTLTIDGEKYNREDLHTFEKDLQKMITNYNYNHKTSICFLFIPEFHSDKKSYHLHGLMSGFPENCLAPFTSDMHLPEYILNKIKSGKDVYFWKQYRERFGFCVIEPVQNPDAVSAYMTKYITEDLASTVQELNAHAYFCSRGLKRSKIVHKGTLAHIPTADFENEYVAIKTFETKEEAESCFYDFEKGENECFYQNILKNGLPINA